MPVLTPLAFASGISVLAYLASLEERREGKKLSTHLRLYYTTGFFLLLKSCC